MLGAGDPFAALIGRRFGTVALINGRTAQGTLAFFITGFAAAVLALSWFHPDVAIVRMALGAASFGAIAELVSRRLDDNLTIPIAAATGAWLLL